MILAVKNDPLFTKSWNKNVLIVWQVKLPNSRVFYFMAGANLSRDSLTLDYISNFEVAKLWIYTLRTTKSKP